MYKNENVSIEFLSEETIEKYNSNYFNWFQYPALSYIHLYNDHGRFYKSKEELKSFLKEANNQNRITWAIIYKNRGYKDYSYRHIGNFSLQEINYIHHSAEFSILIGEKTYHSKGAGTCALEYAIFHGFNILNLNRIWLGTPIENEAMIHVARKYMKQEGILRQAFWHDDRYLDIVRFSILKEEHR